MSDLPTILLVDDQPDTVVELLTSIEGQAQVQVVEPSDVTVDDLYSADLVLVDHYLDRWSTSSQTSPSQRPAHGVALAGSLRSYVDGLGVEPDPRIKATAFALLSGDLARVGALLPDDVREHATARLHGLEWAFDKNEGKSLGPRVLSLARAVLEIQRANERHSLGRDYLTGLLGISHDLSWKADAESDVFECHPPVFELSQSSKGLAPLRWLLHRILPYPTFLVDRLHLATRLRIREKSLGLLEEVLTPFQYQGALREFLGQRWWRVGLEQTIWELTDARRRPLLEALQDAAGVELAPLQITDPVVVMDRQYTPIGVEAGANAVRVQPDDWPAYAEAAWMSASLVSEDPELRRLTVDSDLERL